MSMLRGHEQRGLRALGVKAVAAATPTLAEHLARRAAEKAASAQADTAAVAGSAGA